MGIGTADRVAYWSGTYALASNAGFTFDPSDASLLITTGANNADAIAALSGGSSQYAGIATGRTATEARMAVVRARPRSCSPDRRRATW